MNMKKHNKKAFTLIELLIVIAIIGILFIVLVSKVDFATDKAKAAGVQTDFRSFQLAFEQVAKENAGFNTFGWDEGDTNGDRIRNSFDEGDTNKDGVMQSTETWTGRKVYAETWTGVYTLIKPGTTVLDADAIFALESAINKNLDPKLHITIGTDGTITMANQAMDPWKTEYVGKYLTNASAKSTTNTVVANQATAETSGGDRGAIILYSKGANQELGCVEEIVNGSVIVTVLTKEDVGTANKADNNVAGKDDYSIATIYTYKNGYGEVITTTTGFSNNQTTNEIASLSGTGKTYQMLDGANQTIDVYQELSFRSEADFDKFEGVTVDGNLVNPSNYTVAEGSTIVVLKESYVRTLADGNHRISIVSNDGRANTMFTMDCIDNNVGEKTNITIKFSYAQSETYVCSSTTAKSLGELCREAIDAGQLCGFHGMDDYFIWDYDIDVIYVDNNGRYQKLDDVALQSNETYNFYVAQFGKVFWDEVVEIYYNEDGSFRYGDIQDLDLSQFQYKTIWVDYGMIVGGGSVVCPVFAGVNDTYLDVLYHAPFRWYRPEPDPRIAAEAESTIVSNKAWILYPGYESFGTLQDYLVCGIISNNKLQNLYQKTTDGERVFIYATVFEGESYTAGQVAVEVMDMVEEFESNVNSLRYGVEYVGEGMSVITYPNGSLTVTIEGETQVLPANTVIIVNNQIIMNGVVAGEVATDGSSISLYEDGEVIAVLYAK